MKTNVKQAHFPWNNFKIKTDHDYVVLEYTNLAFFLLVVNGFHMKITFQI